MSEVKVNKISPRIDCGTVTVGDAGDSVTVTAGVPVTVNGDLKSNALKAVDGGSIISQCGTTITLGASGDTINLAAGASQTGFGRTGTVDWDTTAKTASFTAVSGNGYFVNTTSGAITVTLPAGSAGDIVSLADYAATWQTNNVTVTPNGTDKIGGVNVSVTLNTEGQSVTFIYTDSTQGWLNTMDSTSNVRGNTFIDATGGTETTCGDYKIHTFTSPGTFTVISAGAPTGSTTVDYLVVAGGGGGGNGVYAGGGGGAGGYRESSGAASGCYTVSPLGAGVSALPVIAQGYPITVGAGGAAMSPPVREGNQGSNSIFSTITSAGGGAGGGGPNTGASPNSPGKAGGSGGGGATYDCVSGGAGNTPPVSPPQGNSGGGAGCFGATATKGGGGGGATSAGTAAITPPSSAAGPGGNGATSSINATPTTRAGGGGGSTDVGGTQGTGGPGGGGNGDDGVSAGNGSTNTGSGGGGGKGSGGGGGSGIVIIRYKYQ